MHSVKIGTFITLYHKKIKKRLKFKNYSVPYFSDVFILIVKKRQFTTGHTSIYNLFCTSTP